MTNNLPADKFKKIRRLEEKLGLNRCLTIRARLKIVTLETSQRGQLRAYERELEQALRPPTEARPNLAKKMKRRDYRDMFIKARKFFKDNPGKWFTIREFVGEEGDVELARKVLTDMRTERMLLKSTDRISRYIWAKS